MASAGREGFNAEKETGGTGAGGRRWYVVRDPRGRSASSARSRQPYRFLRNKHSVHRAEPRRARRLDELVTERDGDAVLNGYDF